MHNQISHRSARTVFTTAGLLAAIGLAAMTGCTMLLGTGAQRPPATDFGMGPRTSPQGLYTATLSATQALRPRQLQTLQVQLTDAAGAVIDGATINIDGGMPEHGHGLPTHPLVTSNAGSGVYQIEGVRFSMGGWWEFKLAIDTPAGTDTVTFNLDL